mmetsp:Transcript_21327/g.23737  ORF Transcript_21327/g.23737 Transcript_21327/m.23737 type:complete len:142 (-) Transcript_21327:97-522(-)
MKNIQQMDYLWGTLDPGDKGYYKTELVEYKDQFENVKREYFQYDQAVKREVGDEESDEFTSLQKSNRGKLLNGISKLNHMDEQLIGTVRNGNDTVNILRLANREIVDQGVHIENAGRNNRRAQVHLQDANKNIQTMRVREF